MNVTGEATSSTAGMRQNLFLTKAKSFGIQLASLRIANLTTIRQQNG
ncbi:MAG: hypothetical protein ABSF63_14495 [Candidatus Bathyarchaeia archaeon]|jgi:hypothetical protein